MRATGLWDRQDIQGLERRIYKKAHCVPNDIKAQTLMNLVAHSSACNSIEKRARHIIMDLQRQSGLLQYCKVGHGAAAPTTRNRRERIYLPRGVVETVLALSRGRTMIFFGQRHRCVEHDQLLDDTHLLQCSVVQLEGDVMADIDRLRRENIRDWEAEARWSFAARIALLRGRLRALEESGALRTEIQAKTLILTAQEGAAIETRMMEATETRTTEDSEMSVPGG